MAGQPRSFSELVGEADIWQHLHTSFTWLLKAGGLRLQERLVEGPPVNVYVTDGSSSPTGECDVGCITDNDNLEVTLYSVLHESEIKRKELLLIFWNNKALLSCDLADLYAMSHISLTLEAMFLGLVSFSYKLCIVSSIVQSVARIPFSCVTSYSHILYFSCPSHSLTLQPPCCNNSWCSLFHALLVPYDRTWCHINFSQSFSLHIFHVIKWS